MVHAFSAYIRNIAILCRMLVHRFYCFRLVGIWTDMHALHAQPFIISKELHFGKVKPLFSGSFPDRPVKFISSNKIRKPDCRNEMKFLYIGIVDGIRTFLPPESLKRRNHIIK